jgi:hypothetical protein
MIKFVFKIMTMFLLYPNQKVQFLDVKSVDLNNIFKYMQSLHAGFMLCILTSSFGTYITL